MAQENKNVVFIKPLGKTLEQLKSFLEKNAAAQGIEIHECKDLAEALQVIPPLSPALTLGSDPKTVALFLSKTYKALKKKQNRMILVTSKKLQQKALKKLDKLGLTDFITEPVNARTLQYKVSMQIRALPSKKKEGELALKSVEGGGDNGATDNPEKSQKKQPIQEQEAQSQEELMIDNSSVHNSDNDDGDLFADDDPDNDSDINLDSDDEDIGDLDDDSIDEETLPTPAAKGKKIIEEEVLDLSRPKKKINDLDLNTDFNNDESEDIKLTSKNNQQSNGQEKEWKVDAQQQQQNGMEFNSSFQMGEVINDETNSLKEKGLQQRVDEEVSGKRDKFSPLKGKGDTEHLDLAPLSGEVNSTDQDGGPLSGDANTDFIDDGPLAGNVQAESPSPELAAKKQNGAIGDEDLYGVKKKKIHDLDSHQDLSAEEKDLEISLQEGKSKDLEHRDAQSEAADLNHRDKNKNAREALEGLLSKKKNTPEYQFKDSKNSAMGEIKTKESLFSNETYGDDGIAREKLQSNNKNSFSSFGQTSQGITEQLQLQQKLQQEQVQLQKEQSIFEKFKNSGHKNLTLEEKKFLFQKQTLEFKHVFWDTPQKLDPINLLRTYDPPKHVLVQALHIASSYATDHNPKRQLNSIAKCCLEFSGARISIIRIHRKDRVEVLYNGLTELPSTESMWKRRRTWELILASETPTWSSSPKRVIWSENDMCSLLHVPLLVRGLPLHAVFYFANPADKITTEGLISLTELAPKALEKILFPETERNSNLKLIKEDAA